MKSFLRANRVSKSGRRKIAKLVSLIHARESIARRTNSSSVRVTATKGRR